jgi:peptide-methionine (R)-S-oxide reductase
LPTTNKGWQTKLTPEQYRVLRQHDTERPGSSPLVDEHSDGVFRCAGCDANLFRSDDKFDSGTGWPSFTAVAAGDKVRLVRDDSLGLERTEVLCARCGGHLGHLFDNGPADRGGKRFCINGCALNFDKR